jgi:hypothetical protein
VPRPYDTARHRLAHKIIHSEQTVLLGRRIASPQRII